MSSDNLWNKYCSFYDKSFQEQMEYSSETLEQYFYKWKKTDIVKKLGKSGAKNFKDVPITTYDDYPMMPSLPQE